MRPSCAPRVRNTCWRPRFAPYCWKTTDSAGPHHPLGRRRNTRAKNLAGSGICACTCATGTAMRTRTGRYPSHSARIGRLSDDDGSAHPMAALSHHCRSTRRPSARAGVGSALGLGTSSRATSADRCSRRLSIRQSDHQRTGAGLRHRLGACGLGDPMQDLGWLCLKTWRFGGSQPVAGVGTRESLFQAYQQASGNSRPEACAFLGSVWPCQMGDHVPVNGLGRAGLGSGFGRARAQRHRTSGRGAVVGFAATAGG